jgi:hypothetical protein
MKQSMNGWPTPRRRLEYLARRGAIATATGSDFILTGAAGNLRGTAKRLRLLVRDETGELPMAEPDVTNGDEIDDTYDPSTVEANRNIQQGGGVGARDLARQDEPAEIVTPDGDDSDEDAPVEALGTAHPKA